MSIKDLENEQTVSSAMESQNLQNHSDSRNEEVYSAFWAQFVYFITLLQEFIGQIFRDFKIYEIFERVQSTVKKHPFLALVAAAVIFILSLPFVIFIIFAITTAVVTFTGFIFIEGTLITIASVLLFGMMCILIFLIVLFAGVFLAGYFGFMQIYELFDRNTFKNFKLS